MPVWVFGVHVGQHFSLEDNTVAIVVHPLLKFGPLQFFHGNLVVTQSTVFVIYRVADFMYKIKKILLLYLD